MKKKIQSLLLAVFVATFLFVPVATHAQVVDVSTPTTTPTTTPAPTAAPAPTDTSGGKGAGVPATGIAPKNHNVGANLLIFSLGSLIGLALSSGIVFLRRKQLQK